MDMSEIGARMKSRREYLGLSQQEVADAIHKERSSYAQYESGKNEPAAETLYALARKLRVRVGWFYGEEAESKPEEFVYEPIFEELRTAAYDGGMDDRDISEVAEIIRVKAKRHAERQGRA